MRSCLAVLLAVGSATSAPVPKELKKVDDKVAILGKWVIGAANVNGKPVARYDPAAEKRGARLVHLSVPEVRKLLLKLLWAFLPPAERVLACSVRRRRHRHRARECHDRKRGAKPPDD